MSMRWLRLAALVLPAPLMAQPTAEFPPWIVRGFEAALADAQQNVRRATVQFPDAEAITGLIPVGRPAEAVVDELLTLLHDSDDSVRRSAIKTLGQVPLGNRAGEVLDQLLTLVGGGDAGAALANVASSGRSGEVVDKLLLLLDQHDDDVRWYPVMALGEVPIGDRAGKVVSKLIPILENEKLRRAAIMVLGKVPLGNSTSEIVSKLLSFLDDSDDAVRGVTLTTLGQISLGERAGTVTDKLLTLLATPNYDWPLEAVAALVNASSGDHTGEVAGKLLPLLGDQDSPVRGAAATALSYAPLGDRASEVVDKLLTLINPEANLHRVAVEALGRVPLGDRTNEVVDRLLPLLDDRDVNLRQDVVDTLVKASSGYGTDKMVGRLLKLLDNPGFAASRTAIKALGKMPLGNRAGEVVSKLLTSLDSRDRLVRRAAVATLGQMALGNRAGEFVGRLLPLLGDKDVRGAAVTALGQVPLGDRVGEVVERLLPLLDEEDVRGATITTLGQIPLGDRAGVVMSKLLTLLAGNDSEFRLGVIDVLARAASGVQVTEVINRLLTLLNDQDAIVREAAVTALGQVPVGERTEQLIEKLLPMLIDSNTDVDRAAMRTVARLGAGGASVALAALRLAYNGDAASFAWLRAAAHLATGADVKGEQSEVLLAWLGTPPNLLPLKFVENQPAAGHVILALLLKHWSALVETDRLREEAEDHVIRVIAASCRSPADASTTAQWIGSLWAWVKNLPLEGPVQRCWTPDEKRTVEALLGRFKEANSSHTQTLEQHLARERAAPVSQWLTWSLAGWALFWTAFLVAFPWSRTVQAIFFWNPKVRGMLSLWFVPLLLFVAPPLRRRLLAPFRDDLVAAARLQDLPKLGFFLDTRAALDGGSPAAVREILPQLHGTVVLRGEAGLGKTSTLRWVAANTTKPVAFLPARDCREGVDAAIARIIRGVQEKEFVRSLIYAGALRVIVDGLNEVSADTREQIRSFAFMMAKGNVMIGTQPIEWKLPENARVLDLLPLDRSEAERFLLSRPVGSNPAQAVNGEDYARAVTAFLQRALDEAPSEDERSTAELVLSNPFDLSFAADLLAQGQMPLATALIDEAFNLADHGSPGVPGYRSVTGQPFPLVRFGNQALAMRIEDRNWFKSDEFPAEMPSLLERKLVVRRAVYNTEKDGERIQFRHDRVWDFFIAAAFLTNPDLWLQHLADARFRGAYFRIAETWPVEDAKRVRDRMVVTAAKSGDHTTSDEFIKRLDTRSEMIQPVSDSALAPRLSQLEPFRQPVMPTDLPPVVSSS